ncbi:sterol glucosyltransferase [Phlyctema vagabunda]|uniref:Sterol glucosyltransferase n=1 Tax=Phlyctema vagabunda TaxID=108571 RepID=A0ABR4PLL5_9HELO
MADEKEAIRQNNYMAERQRQGSYRTQPSRQNSSQSNTNNTSRQSSYASNATATNSSAASFSNASLRSSPSYAELRRSSSNSNLRQVASYGSLNTPPTTGPPTRTNTVELPSDDGNSVLHSPSTIDWEEPPPYEIAFSGRGGQVSAEVQNNGRISMMFNSSAKIPDMPMAPLDEKKTEEDYKKTELSPAYAYSTYPILTIVIQVVGSRGDVQPFVALGQELMKSGHRVRLATHPVFEKFVEDAGLEFFSIGGDPEQLMAYMVNNPGIIPKFAAIRAGEIAKKRKMVYEILEGCWHSCIDPDPKTAKPFIAEAIIANPPSFAHMHCAQALGIPIHLMFTMPWTPTRAFPHPLANISKSDRTEPQTSNYLSYGLVEMMTWQGLSDVINLWRRRSLHLDPIRAMMGPGLAEYLKVPFTYCWSPALVPKPRDWPSYVDVCGFFFRDTPKFDPPPVIDDFLKAGTPPIYIGFGSIVMENAEEVTKTIMKAIEITGTRAIVSRGWSKLGSKLLESEQTPNVIFIDDCPHEWLFQHVTAVVHHGGAGTTACGLRNGKPTTIVPFFGDQPFWGNMVAAAGAGPRPIEHKNLNTDRLVEAIRTCLTPEALEAARRIAEKMRYEDGVKEAVKSFHRNLPILAMSCDLLPRKAAVWQYKNDKTFLKLSDKAAFILMEQKKIEIKNLKRYRPKPIEIEHKRWEPLSAGSSVLFGAVVDVANDGKDMFTQPIKELQKASSMRKEGGGGGGSGAAEAGHAFSRGLGRVGGSVAKGVVDLPVAMADGFHAIPSLYGEKLAKRGAVTDWKSGAIVATKGLGMGFFNGFTGIVTQPIKGAMDDGFKGFGKGFVAGSLGVVVKPGAAMLGLVGYSMLGAYKSISARNATPTEAKILLARQIQGSELARHVKQDDEERQLVLKEFDTKSQL